MINKQSLMSVTDFEEKVIKPLEDELKKHVDRISSVNPSNVYHLARSVEAAHRIRYAKLNMGQDFTND